MVGSRDSAAVRALPQQRDGGSGPCERFPTSRTQALAYETAAHGHSTGPTILPAAEAGHRKSYIDAEPTR
jgi:hypothetical protein